MSESAANMDAWETQDWEDRFSQSPNLIPLTLYGDFTARGLTAIVDCRTARNCISAANQLLCTRDPALEPDITEIRQERQRLLEIGFLLLESDYDRRDTIVANLCAMDDLLAEEQQLRRENVTFREVEKMLQYHTSQRHAFSAHGSYPPPECLNREP